MQLFSKEQLGHVLEVPVGRERRSDLCFEERAERKDQTCALRREQKEKTHMHAHTGLKTRTVGK
jgi:hypothetical protein